MTSCNSPIVSFTNQIRSRVLSAETVSGTGTASFGHSFVVYMGGELSSCEEARGKTSVGLSHLDRRGGGDGESDGVPSTLNIAAE
eukprot:1177595-Prorocentrum_lima.AAC.1